jgi:hypothetical protein
MAERATSLAADRRGRGDDEASAAACLTSLYCDDRELRRRIAPHLGLATFKATLRACEAKDPNFPRVSPLWRGRYFPAVKAWLDRNEGLDDHGLTSPTTEDGPETFDAAPRKSPRVEGRPVPAGARPPPAVLVREERGEGPHGLPRRLHPIAGGR